MKNWRRRKREWKKSHPWTRRNGSNKSIHVMWIITKIKPFYQDKHRAKLQATKGITL